MNPGNTNRSAERFNIPKQGDGRLTRQATLQYSADSEALPIEIRDLSIAGAGFIASHAPKLESVVILSIECQGQTVQFRAAIRWVRPFDGRWRAGCKIDPPLSREFFAFESPERQLTDIVFTAQRELNPNDRMPVTISNYSKGGICICASEVVAPGENLLFKRMTPDGPVRFVAKVAWGRPDLNCYLMGCQFIGACDAEVFRSAVGENVEPVQETDVVATDTTRTDPPGVRAACGLVYGLSVLIASGIL